MLRGWEPPCNPVISRAKGRAVLTGTDEASGCHRATEEGCLLAARGTAPGSVTPSPGAQCSWLALADAGLIDSQFPATGSRSPPRAPVGPWMAASPPLISVPLGPALPIHSKLASRLPLSQRLPQPPLPGPPCFPQAGLMESLVRHSCVPQPRAVVTTRTFFPDPGLGPQPPLAEASLPHLRAQTQEAG